MITFMLMDTWICNDYLDTDGHLDILTFYESNEYLNPDSQLDILTFREGGDYLDKYGHLDMLTLLELMFDVLLWCMDSGSNVHISRG